jgi:hypothetical protein
LTFYFPFLSPGWFCFGNFFFPHLSRSPRSHLPTYRLLAYAP